MAAPIKIEFHPEAIEETRAARAWYRERSTRAEKAFLGELRRALRQVRESPETWPKIERGARRFVLRRFPFSFVYRLTQDGIQILALAHGKRRPGYWSRR